MKKFLASLSAGLLLVAFAAPAADGGRGGGPNPCPKNSICLPGPEII